jgi:hypothetical protein
MQDTVKQADRLAIIRLRYLINTHLEDQGISTPAAIGAATGLLPAEAVRLLTHRQWWDGSASSSGWMASTCHWARNGRHERAAVRAP